MDMHRFVVLSILKKHELSELYVMMALRALAMSLVGIFVPVYLYILGYGVLSIILFFMAVSATHALLCPVSAKVSSKVGVKHGMLFGFLLYFIYYVSLAMLADNSRLFFFVAAALGAAQAMFWVPFHAFFPVFTDKKKRGEEIALLQIFLSTVSVVAPFIGGLIILFFGFDTLFSAGLAVLMAAALPLFATRDVRFPFTSFRADGFHRKVAVSLFSGSSAWANEIFWPLFAFMIVGSAAVLGGIVAFATLVAFVAIWIVGKLCDNGHRKGALELGSAGQSAKGAARTP